MATLTGIDHSDLRIGGGATEFVLTGEGLDAKGLVVAIMTLKGDAIDADRILIEQPQKDDVTPGHFPFTATALPGAATGPRGVLVKQKADELDGKGGCKSCLLLAEAIVVM